MQETKETFWQLLQPEYVRVTLFCRKLVGDRDAADDLLQDALMIALTKLHQLRDADSFRPWLYRIVISTFRMMVRRPWWKRRVSLNPVIEQERLTVNPTDRLNARRWLDRAFKAVSPDEQVLVSLHELEQWTIAELAELCGKSESAIKTRLFRARQKMRKALMHLTKAAKSKTEHELMADGNIKCVAAKHRVE